ncbi:MAG: hypothetical protein ACLR7Z_15880 [Bilophila wadsworthia]
MERPYESTKRWRTPASVPAAGPTSSSPPGASASPRARRLAGPQSRPAPTSKVDGKPVQPIAQAPVTCC